MNKLIQTILFTCFCLCTQSFFAKGIYSITTVKSENIEIKKSTHIKDKDSVNNRERTSDQEKITVRPTKGFRNFKSLERFDKISVVHKSFEIEDQEEGDVTIADGEINNKWLEMANQTFATIEETQNYVDLLSDDSLQELPVAIKPKEISNVKYTVGIAKAVFKPAYTELTAFLKVETARGTLVLGESNIKLSHEGGIIGDAKLNLISQFTFNINSGKVIVTLNGSFNESGTYATIDCSGFKELGIDANVEFSNELLHPVDQNGKKKIGSVEGNFKTVVADWNDIVANIELPEFGIKGIEGTTFKLNTAIFDFSDLRNDDAMPGDYLNKYYTENPTLWRGVYVSTLKVVLPKAFEKKNSNKRVSFEASNLIIDEQGVTGRFEGENILTIDEGSASKWKFSLDHFLLDVETNSLTAGEFSGELLLPVSEVDRLKYDAIIRPEEEYSLRVTSTKEMNFDVWNAKVSLTKDSYIEMKVKDNKFRPKANLNGSVSIQSGLSKSSSGSSGKKTVDFKGIVFEKMVLQTESPKFSVDYFGYRGKMNLANFPVTVNEIGVRSRSGNKVALVFDFNINLSSESDGGNGGGAKLAIKAKLDETDNRDHWKYDGIDLERVFVQMEVAGTELKGAIFIFEDDPVYGTGFAGAVGAKFSTGMQLELEAKALFGRTPEFRYWFADAQVTLPVGIPIFAGFALNSFGGGIYNHMKMDGVTYEENAAYNTIGASTSGVIYKPYKENGFGMKATVGIITQNSESLFHGTLEFGMAFLNSGGLQDIYFRGHGELLVDLPIDFYDKLQDQLGYLAEGLEIPAQSPTAAISGDVFLGYDFVNDIFHSTSELYVNFGILKGIGPNGRAGWMDFYIGPDEWHLLIGTPTDPIGLELNLLGSKMRTESYFMAGDNIPNSSPPPNILANILGVEAAELDATRDLNSLGAGRGMAFGSNWSMSTGDLRFLIFYARFDAGIGFDLMLKDYGDAHCKGSSNTIGLNGWYATGQAYAYLQGDVGLKIKVFGKRKKVSVFSGGGAILLQAQLPNPVWLRGYLSGKYNVLGGLVKGSFRFKVQMGKKCEIDGAGALDGIVVIGDMSPKDKGANIDVFAAPQVAFNLQINKVFELQDDTGYRKYRILMDKFEVTRDGKPIVGDIKWNTNNDLAVFYSHEILPPETDIKAYVQLHFEEYINGKWETIKDQGKEYLESKEVTFTTGTAPESIPLSNIAYMYPTIEQKNFFTKEYDKGYVKLKRGQSYLFDNAPGWNKTMSMESDMGTEMNKKFTYNKGNKQIIFELPQEMATQTAYSIQIALEPPSSTISDNVKESYTTTTVGGESGNTLEVRSKEIKDVLVNGEKRELLVFDFGTSQYTTFHKKMNAIKQNQNLYEYVPYPYGLVLYNTIDPIEPFDMTELLGNKYTADVPLVIAKAAPSDSYYQKEIYPLLYQNYPLEGTFSVTRKTDKVGVPPIEGVEPMAWYITHLEHNQTGKTNTYHPYRYNLTHYYYKDYEDLRYQLVNSNLSWEVRSKYTKLIIDPLPVMKNGKYKTTFQYILPGQVKKGKNKTVKFTNPLYE
ncbi:hypothetical protein [Aquimarina aquimarini]|uniref:hypothetical protein n=1 Tax=Aquimarina aquimarini TaxID=1191734 RepID=UPI000D55D2B2|nr:hypothetical protein [Aquimarina aquimarini]